MDVTRSFVPSTRPSDDISCFSIERHSSDSKREIYSITQDKHVCFTSLAREFLTVVLVTDPSNKTPNFPTDLEGTRTDPFSRVLFAELSLGETLTEIGITVIGRKHSSLTSFQLSPTVKVKR
jgi:hypothetical protein